LSSQTEKRNVYELLRKNLPEIHWQRIENVAGTGVADVNGCCDGVEFWSESKVAKNGEFEIRPDQIAWLTLRRRHGGRVFVTVREEQTLSIYVPDGEGSFTLVGLFRRPFNYRAIKEIFLKLPLNSVI
jgi:hypothetical protein